MTDSPNSPHPPGRRPNRLVHETSPYLKQHAYNPVDWYPWGPETLEAAAKLDRPIFLSIGDSACHWCHVMEHESFEDADIAELMNQHFINVKVDREERPDLDQIYMSAVTALTGRGAGRCPSSSPPHASLFTAARTGLPIRGCACSVSGTCSRRFTPPGPIAAPTWKTAGELTDAIVEMGRSHAEPQPLDVSLLRTAHELRLRAADRVHGGFGGAEVSASDGSPLALADRQAIRL